MALTEKHLKQWLSFELRTLRNYDGMFTIYWPYTCHSELSFVTVKMVDTKFQSKAKTLKSTMLSVQSTEAAITC